MSFSALIQQSVATGGVSIEKSKTYSAASRVSLDETIADSETDKQVTVAIDVSAVKAFYIVSDQDITLETNDGTTPDDTLSLVADVPYVWTTDSYDTFKLSADVTAFFFTNSSGSAANVKMECVLDPTP